MTRAALPIWAQNIVPVDMDGAAILLGVSRRFLVDVLREHRHYELRGTKKVFYPEHIEKLKIIISPPSPTTPVGAIGSHFAKYAPPEQIALWRDFFDQTFEGNVYIIRCHSRVKIGFTDNWSSRLRTLKTSCPYPVFVVAVFPGNRTMEGVLHRVFHDLRRHGEWFDEVGGLAELVAAIEALQ